MISNHGFFLLDWSIQFLSDSWCLLYGPYPWGRSPPVILMEPSWDHQWPSRLLCMIIISHKKCVSWTLRHLFIKQAKYLKTDFSLRGVGRQHTGSAKVINNCCEYAETLMKYVLCLSAGETISEDNINTLMNILAAQIKYLQSENAVCSNFRIWRCTGYL